MRWLCVWVICVSSCINDQALELGEKAVVSEIVDNVLEVDTRVSLGPDSSVAYTRYQAGYYNVFRRNGAHSEQISRNINCYYPFFLGGKVGFLSSPDNDSRLICNLSFAGLKQNSTRFQWIYSLAIGQYLVFALEGDNTIYLFDFKKDELTSLFQVSSKFSGCSYSAERDLLVFSLDERLILYDPKVKRASEIETGLSGEKATPHFSDGRIYFCSNSSSEFFRIYSSDADSVQPTNNTRLVYQEPGNDIRMPKVLGNRLYFISVFQSKYLLKSLDLSSAKVEPLTQTGVVYDFFPQGHKKVLVIFSGPLVPRCLGDIDLTSNLLTNLTQPNIDVSVSYSYATRPNLVPAYYMKSNRNKKIRGVILFFRPGNHGDFSPRWDTILVTLCELGYMIVAPNYHGSTGYGKTYFDNQGQSEVDDMLAWTNHLKKQWPGYPLFCLAFSSGNKTMEAVIEAAPQDITAGASFSGIQTGINPGRLKVPVKYFLGKKDQIIDADLRYHELVNAGVPSSDIRIFNGEGHWIIDHNNIKEAIFDLVNFYRGWRW